MAEITTPHDAVFKTFLSRVETARDFIELHLPPSLIKICKLETLRLESGSFVEDDLRPYFSDILYSLETTSGHGYVHVLIEHQSSPDKHMSFRLMRCNVILRRETTLCRWLFQCSFTMASKAHGKAQ